MTFDSLKTLETLCLAPGVSSYERRSGGPVEAFKKILDTHGVPHWQDKTGSVIAKRGDGPKKLMLTAHIDEVGFTVAKIEKDGRIRVIPVGGINPGYCVAQEVEIFGGKHHISGIMTTLKSPATDNVTWTDCFVDVGATSATDVKVRVGDMVAWPRRFYTNTVGLTTCFSPALDNRVGCTAMLGAFLTAFIPDDISLYILAAVHHEQGNAYGAWCGTSEIEPDAGIVMDSAYAKPLIGEAGKAHWFIPELGGGAAIQKLGTHFIVADSIFRHIAQVAEDKRIAHQYEFPDRDTGGTDYVGAARAAGGVPTGVINTPVRYQHTPLLMVALEDINSTIDLVKAIIKEGLDPWNLKTAD